MIRIEGLVKSYGAIEVLHGIELVVPVGELFAYLGPNCTGKNHHHPDPHRPDSDGSWERRLERLLHSPEDIVRQAAGRVRAPVKQSGP